VSTAAEHKRYGEAGPRPEGTVMTVNFELDGKPFLALNGGPQYSFSEAISFQIDCAGQGEVDRYWNALSDGGEEGPCGWLKDRFGVSWQVVPRRLTELLSDPDPAAAQRVMQAMLGMRKIEIPELERAAAGREIGAE
jgi:predicted 3-demethylubiquinone-9 3-methyltransferase (glyoxalase superfamily)